LKNNIQINANLNWSIFDNIISSIIQIISNVIFLNYLNSTDFGIFVFCLAIVNLIKPLIDLGLFHALIQETSYNDAKFSTVFYTNFFISSFLFFVINAFTFNFNIERQGIEIKETLFILSFLLIFEGINISHRAYLTKHLKFEFLAKLNIFSRVISNSICLLLLFLEYGLIALCIKEITQALTQTFLYLLFSNKSRMSINDFNKNHLFGLVSFGKWIFISDQIENFIQEMSIIILGIKFKFSELGFYERGNLFSNYIVNGINIAINKVSTPTLSLSTSLQDIQNSYGKYIRTSFFLTSPIIIFAMITCDYLFPILFGNKWDSSLIYFKIALVSGFFFPFSIMSLSVFKILNMPKLYFIVSIITKSLIFCALLFGLYFQLTTLAFILLSSKIFVSFSLSYISGRKTGYTLLNQVKDIQLHLLFFVIAIIISFFSGIFSYTLRVEMYILLVLLFYSFYLSLLRKLRRFTYV
jgi:O-antigen/teichoic acid export membrane protein